MTAYLRLFLDVLFKNKLERRCHVKEFTRLGLKAGTSAN
jgi:hypothetical protein